MYGMALYHDLGYGKLDPANLDQASCYWDMACDKAGSVSDCTCVGEAAAKEAVEQAIDDAVSGTLSAACEGYVRAPPGGRTLPSGRRLNHKCKSRNARSCHPAHATVELASGDHTRLDALAVGDTIRTPSGFEPVVGFLHAEKHAPTPYYKFTTEANLTVAIADAHYLFVDGVEADPASVKLGQTLSTPTGPQAVTAITKETHLGAFHPITPSGAYYADGLAASTYVSYIPHSAWKVFGDGYITLRYKLGLPVMPEGAHHITLFWFLDLLRGIGLSDDVAARYAWPLIAGSVATTEIVSSAVMAAGEVAKMVISPPEVAQMACHK
jgi:hypothetical protein